MADVNKQTIIGNLGADPELRYTPGGVAVANLNVATNESWTNKDGEKVQRTEWHRVIVWGKQAENCKNYLVKGAKVHIEGPLKTRVWEDREGVKHFTKELHAREINFLSALTTAASKASSSNSQQQDLFDSEDIPF